MHDGKTAYNWFTTGYRFDPETTIRNSGMGTNHSFAVDAYLHGGMVCLHNYFYEKILPGFIADHSYFV